jgi:hypothetical protein
VTDILGGAGSYSAVGARIFSPPPSSETVGWIVDCGSDFPAELRTTIASWGTGCLLRETPKRLTTRGWNGYGDNDFRGQFFERYDLISRFLILFDICKNFAGDLTRAPQNLWLYRVRSSIISIYLPLKKSIHHLRGFYSNKSSVRAFELIKYFPSVTNFKVLQV